MCVLRLGNKFGRFFGANIAKKEYLSIGNRLLTLSVKRWKNFLVNFSQQPLGLILQRKNT